MENRRELGMQRGKARLYVVFLTILFAQSTGAIAVGSCKDNEYYRNDTGSGFCCDKCPPGYRLKEQCPGEGQRSVCEKCEAGYFLDKLNYFGNCFRCKRCKDLELEISPCEPHRDRVCGCKLEFYTKNNECKRCTRCGPGQKKIGGCTGANDTLCVCEDNHYPISSRYCRPVGNFSGCPYPSPSETTSVVQPSEPIPSTRPKNSQGHIGMVIALIGLGLGTVFALALAGYCTIKRFQKQIKSLFRPEKPRVPESSTEILISEPSSNERVCSVPVPALPPETETSRKLPDCVPRPIKTHQFIYSVLDVVPVGRFKELVRHLGVTEQDIDRAERDNRTFKEAQYQMLKVWADSSNGGGSNNLPRQLFQELMETLREMGLCACAEHIEKSYSTED
ncbi:tumor necrosis factor receptor superfamily member 1A [Chanos chanos]|uniref:Tumor necrosis factor receptor superfamily member 1A n=1 Tax=Chanos chanos TaxID=29144 RepID=A0A6J2W9V1_CHACN|nr:tumor necrosis factor receptor superfamily member 1A [Chanos chanos]